MGVWLLLGVFEGVVELEGELVGVRDAVGVPLGVILGVGVPLGVTLALLDCVAVLLGVGVPLGVTLALLDCVAVLLGVGVPLGVTADAIVTTTLMSSNACELALYDARAMLPPTGRARDVDGMYAYLGRETESERKRKYEISMDPCNYARTLTNKHARDTMIREMLTRYASHRVYACTHLGTLDANAGDGAKDHSFRSER